MAAPHLPHHVDVPAGLDLHLDALIAQLQVMVHAREERVQARLDAETHPHGDPLPRSSEHARQRLAPQPRDQVHVGELDAGPGHGVAAECREAGRHVGQAADPSSASRRTGAGDAIRATLDAAAAPIRQLYTTREPSGFGNDAGGRIVRRNEC